MSIQEDIAALVKQESTLTLPGFTPDTAWQLGTTLRRSRDCAQSWAGH